MSYGGNCITPFGAKSALFLLVRIFRKVPMTNRICHFAKNRTSKKIIEFGPSKRVMQFPLKTDDFFDVLAICDDVFSAGIEGIDRCDKDAIKANRPEQLDV